jgi:hypothetical protein
MIKPTAHDKSRGRGSPRPRSQHAAHGENGWRQNGKITQILMLLIQWLIRWLRFNKSQAPDFQQFRYLFVLYNVLFHRAFAFLFIFSFSNLYCTSKFYFCFISPSSHEWLFCCILCLPYLFIFGLSHGTLVVPFSLIFPTTVRLFITLFFYFFLLFLEVGCVGIKKHCVWAFLLFL